MNTRENFEGLKWQGTERLWKNRVGKNWVAKRILGRGGQGIVGHWSYEGPDRAMKAVKDVVVKQSVAVGPLGNRRLGLSREARALQYFEDSGSPHIIKMYRHLYEEQGNYCMSLDEGTVHRMFMEYCPGGDLFNWFQTKRHKDENITELEMWAVFHCLARGALVMHIGSEDTSRLRWQRNIVHFDVKHANILLGSRTTDDEHIDMPVFKFGDFGLAVDVPPVQGSKYQKEYQWYGTVPFYAPEQRRKYSVDDDIWRPWIKPSGNLLKSFDYGSHTNVWQIGLVMWCLKHRLNYPKWPTRSSKAHIELIQSTLSHRLKTGGLTLGMGDDIDEEKHGCHSKYSKGLNALIKECLLIQPPSRPSPESLVVRTKRGLEMCHRRVGTPLHPVPTSHIPQNLPSSRWFSKDLRHMISTTPEPQRTLPLSDLIHRVEDMKLQGERKDRRMRVQKRRSWAARLNLGGNFSPKHQVVASIQRFPNPFSSSADSSRMRDLEPIIPPGLLAAGAVAGAAAGAAAGVAADIGAGIGEGIGVGLGMVKDRLHAGLEAGAHRLAEALNPPGPERSDEWQDLPQQTKGKGKAPEVSKWPLHEEALVPLPVLYCIVKNFGIFGQVKHTHVKLIGLYKGTTIIQLKARLMKEGVTIPLNRMRIMCGVKVLNDNDTLAALNGQTTIRVEKE